MLDDQARKEIVEMATAQVVKAILGESYDRSRILDNARGKVAEQVADRYLREHELELLKSLDIETISKLATLRLMQKIADKL